MPRQPAPPPCLTADLAPPAPLSELLTPEAAAARLAVSTKVLERWRGAGDGPPFVRLSRKSIRYQASAVEAFIASRVRTSTAQG